MNAFTQIRRNDQPIYLDYQATTPMDPRVLEAMMPYFTYKFGNPHSRSHSYGWEAEEGVEKARGQVAKLIGADEKEVIFTSGATESNNLAIRGVAEFYKDRKNHIVTTVTEHKCVLDTCRHLEQSGFEVTYLPVQKNGLIDLEVLRAAVTDKTVVVSIMAVNNEIGVIQPLAEIGKICREKKAFFHTDAAQAAGKIPLDVEAMNIDLMGITGLSVSSGSACTSASLEPSYVLRALGVEEDMAHTSLRIGLGRFTSEHEVDTAVDELVRHVNKLREMSPLWEMAQEGIDMKSIEWAAH